MRYQPRDRCPICDFGFWDETPGFWYEQGLPTHLNAGNLSEFLGMEFYDHRGVGIASSLFPTFKSRVVEDRGDEVVEIQGDGVRVLRGKTMSSIPVHLSHLLRDRKTWNLHFKHRMSPNTPGRIPKDWDERVKKWADPNRDYCLVINGGSLYGNLRSWMGVEQISYTVYDDPKLFEEMVETTCELVCWSLQKAIDAGVKPDGCSMWEDMCYNAGPLLGVDHFKKYLVPRYKRITDLLHKMGVDIIWLDCDGCIEQLMPLWLDAGINCMFPIEIGTWGADPVRYRKEYGKDLLMMGGFSKLKLAESPEAITKEIERLAPLVEEGGFIPFCDHRVPPSVPLKNYIHYLKTARKVWGKDLNLKPMPDLKLD
jgi:uroporphyrinogen decarboxylase